MGDLRNSNLGRKADLVVCYSCTRSLTPLWASDQGIDPRLITFIQQNRQYLNGSDTTSEELQTAHAGLVKTPDRRARVRWLFNTEATYHAMHPALRAIGRAAFLREV